ncbi:mogroside IE synthase-like [Euphorbia lathyris]|uniref:mogroside IE synthase-like n=1 Tax=Euphorbia lathyris TaxID=212925 RepID=UPI00331412B1
MEKEDIETHIVAFPFPAQGHINPMFQFCKRLASRGIKVTLITYVDEDLIRTNYAKHPSIKMESICNNSDENLTISSMEDYWKDFRSKLCTKLSEIVGKTQNMPISCLVYDSIMPWALEVAREFGVSGASFFTQSCAVSAIYNQFHQGLLEIPDEEACVSVGGMPLMVYRDLPTSVGQNLECPYHLSLMTTQFSNVKEADWIFFNSFDSLEHQVMKWMEIEYPLNLIGPAIPRNYLDNKEHGINLFKPNTNTYMDWLNSKEPSSVVYISFGSIAALPQNQMEQLANAFKSSKYNFLWVVRESEQNKLPTTFLEGTSDKGLVVSWCSQPQVLSHSSVGCFVTHCGWNSTLEALCLGVPMVAVPQWSDQLTNAKFIDDVWKVGVRVKVDGDGIVVKEELEFCIREVMEGDRADEMRENCEKWKRLANEAMEEGGSSDKNIDQFVAELKGNVY